ncbi:MAG: DUF349 domain-containing protein, partial [Pseudomonadota bacterium]
RRFEAALAASGEDDGARKKLAASLAGNLEQKLRICLDLEIAADIESPAEFAEARMQHRVQQLSAALSSGGGSTGKSARALIDEWYATGPVESAEHDALEARFKRALEAAGAPANK